MHPRRAALLALGDKETAQNCRVATHLANCEKCRREMRHIRREKQALAAGVASVEIDGRRGLAGVLSAIAEWQRNSAGASELRNRLRSQIETYFGSSALEVVEPSGMPPEELLVKTGEILDIFLGQAAAEALRDDVLDGLACARPEVWR